MLHSLVRCVCVCECETSRLYLLSVVTCGSRELCSAFQRYQPVPGSGLRICGVMGRRRVQKEPLSALWNV